MARKMSFPSLVKFVISFCLCFCFENVFGMSGGFYADNFREQSVLYKPMGKKDKREFEMEILHLLGLESLPRPRSHDTHNSAPQYLLDLYQMLENDPSLEHTNRSSIKLYNGSTKTLSDSDMIVSFVNKIVQNSQVPHLRHQRNRRFWFDITESANRQDEEIMASEFRIYRYPKLTTDPDASYILQLFSVTEDGYTYGEKGIEENVLEHVDEIEIAPEDTGWLVFNATGPVTYWMAYPERNHGFYLKIKGLNTSKSSIDPHEIGIVGPKGEDEKQPFLVAFFKSSVQLQLQKKLHRKTRAAKKRQHESSQYYDAQAWNPYTNTHDIYPSRRSCQRLTLYVSFKDLGWQDFIIAPDGYGAYICHGTCSFPLNANMNATNHAIVKTLVHLMDPSIVSKPCCAPTELSAITVLYFDDNSNVILKRFKNMVVKSCGCH